LLVPAGLGLPPAGDPGGHPQRAAPAHVHVPTRSSRRSPTARPGGAGGPWGRASRPGRRRRSCQVV